MSKSVLNLRDLGGLPLANGEGVVPHGLFLRSGKLSVLSSERCAELCQKYRIDCVIDLRTPVEAVEFPDPLPDDVKYIQIPLLKDAAVGISHETGSDPMTIIRRLRKNPEKLKEMVPDFKTLYKDVNSLGNTAIAILNRQAHLGWTSYGHSAASVPVFAIGQGAEQFTGWMDNTDIVPKIMKALEEK